MDKVRRLIFIAGILTLLQILLYKAIINLTCYLFPLNSIGVQWGLYQAISFILFVFFIFLINLSLTLLNIKKITLFITLGLWLGYVSLIYEPYNLRPYRILLRIMLSFGFSSMSFVIIYLWNMRLKTIKN
ncbi:hypothetical protein GCM10011368_06680 [Hyunsoonleella pacifica]|nr:hypothetical protein GCM10011368_06680 [Hyunsoonleella pacifica]